MNKKKVDVVIPVYHPGSEFKKLMERLERQTYEVNRIFLMHTTDGQSLESMKERYKNVTVEEITPDEFDHAATRDKGIRQSDADIVICMTQDACPDNEYLVSELVQALEEANVAVAYARQLPRKESTLLERYTRQFNYPPESKVKSSKDLERMGIKTFFCSDVCAAYNRDMYLKNGGFEKKAIFNEDKIMAIAIKTIPVLTGDVAERFIEIAESSRNTATTVIPEGAQDAIRRMMERSKNVKIKLPL